ncbi:hypothetical protein [Palleronia sp.]|uniref:hypothetical protein n=1 Tax=Palleronia sp. TaxID=1940284 RepID=UPI0035C7B206
MFRDIWDARLARSDEATKTLKSDLKKIEGQIETMLDRIVESNTGSVVAAYEKRISKLETQKILIEEQVAKSGKPLHTLEESFELALHFLLSP